jgi:hypothetical protein
LKLKVQGESQFRLQQTTTADSRRSAATHSSKRVTADVGALQTRTVLPSILIMHQSRQQFFRPLLVKEFGDESRILVLITLAEGMIALATPLTRDSSMAGR